jgi:two-component system, OmpR family, sensor histidine kinase SenX3
VVFALTAAIVVLTLVVVSDLATRRAARRRVDASAIRLGDRSELPGRGGLEGSIARLERAVDAAALEIDGARVSASRATRALDAIPQGIVVCNEIGEIVFRNEVAQAFASARHAEVIVEEAIGDVLSAAVTGVPQRRTLDVLGPPRRMLVISAHPLDDGSRSTGALAIVDDVSERRRLDEIRRDFVANISHELRTPVGALALLAETISAEDDPLVNRRLAERMTAEASRVGRIIDDLLALSRIEAEEHPVREPVAIGAIFEDALDRVLPAAELKHITIVSDDLDRGLTVRGDRRQLVTALTNLLENASNYSDEGAQIEILSTTAGSWVEIAVRDHGIGIPTRDLERVFERFYRVDRARSRHTGGTGLGLAIVRHVAANHRGEVRVESREGDGSTFTLRLPVGSAPVAATDVWPFREGGPG